MVRTRTLIYNQDGGLRRHTGLIIFLIVLVLLASTILFITFNGGWQ